MSRSVVDPARTISDSEQLELPAARIVPRVTSTDTAGGYTVMEYDAPPHFVGPALHRHAITTEWIYVVSGTVAFTLDDETIMLERGETLLILPGTTHTFWNPTAHSVSLLVIVTPGGIEGYYAELTALISGNPGAAARNDAVIASLAARYDILPPPYLT
jgi:quercetin dioxygenase-like cupin family protein